MQTRCLRLLPIAALFIAAPADGQRPLRVLEIRPGPDATPGDVFTITFDRPVAGTLEQAFDPARVVRLTPAIAARIEWRDPSTIRVVPDAPLMPGHVYELAIDSGFRAADGSRLAAPVRLETRVHGPRLLGSNPRRVLVGTAVPLDPEGNLKLLYSAPVDSAQLARVRLELHGDGPCARGSVPFRVIVQRIPELSERWPMMNYAPLPPDPAADRFVRVVELRPRTPLPGDCSGDLVLPSLDSLDAPEIRYRARTASRFSLLPFRCRPNDCLSARSVPLRFTAPVQAVDVAAHIRFDPPASFEPTWEPQSGTGWNLTTHFAPRRTYRVILDSTLRDVYDRPLEGERELIIRTGDHWPAVGHFVGIVTIPSDRPPSIRVRHVNVDSVELILTPVPESQVLEAMTRAGPWPGLFAWRGLETHRRLVALPRRFNEAVTTDVPLPELARRFRGRLVGVQLRIRRTAPGLVTRGLPPSATLAARTDTLPTPAALVQSTNLVIHARAGVSDGAVFVTDLRSGHPVPDAWVRLRDRRGVVLSNGRTDTTGVAVFRNVRPPAPTPGAADPDELYPSLTPFDGRVVEVTARGDRGFALVQNGYLGGLGGLACCTGDWFAPSILPLPRLRAVIFTDRDVYRPGEQVYVAAVLREGATDSLRPLRGGTRLRWRVRMTSLEGWTTIREIVTRLSAFGTSVDSFQISPRARLGSYWVDVAVHDEGRWKTATSSHYSVAEYRAPEFLVHVSADTATRLLGDTARATVSARFLFDAPMGHARVRWSAMLEEPDPGELPIRNLPAGFTVGDQFTWWEPRPRAQGRRMNGEDTLDAAGRLELRVSSDSTDLSRGARVTWEVSIEDANRQTVSATATQRMYGARFYLAMRDRSTGYWWNAGTRQSMEVLAVRPDGDRVAGVRVRADVVRWRYDEDRPGGRPSGRWRWLADTVHSDSLLTADSAVVFPIVSGQPGYHTVVVSAQDEAGRPIRSSVAKYVIGRTAIVRRDAPASLDVVLPRADHRVGDTARVAFVSPFDSAEAWVTVERERVLWQRRMTVTPGPVTVPIPVPESFVPNVYVGVLLVNRGDATASDSAHHRMRHGLAGLGVERAPKRLAVSVQGERAVYAPGDSAAASIRVRDAAGRAAPGAVAVWAVDEGVLSLTGYERPDVLAWFYGIAQRSLLFSSTSPTVRSGEPTLLRRMLGYDIFGNPLANRLSEVVVTGAAASSATISMQDTKSVAWQGSVTIRQDFRSTAFFRAFVTTDDSGAARVSFKLPDNITTFRLIAVALSRGDRFGGSESSLVVTRPLVVRAALPRFVRPGDEFLAGGVVNARDARPRTIRVGTSATGLALGGDSARSVTLTEAGTEARFPWRVTGRDSVRVQLRVDDGVERDAVSVKLPVRPEYSPRAHTLAGVVRDSATLAFVLPGGIDPARSRLTLRIGSSPLPTIQVAGRYLRAYPYYCAEQLMSVGRWLASMLSLHRAGVAGGQNPRELRRELQRVVDQLEKRQTVWGGFGYWSNESWTTPWLSAHVGLLLLEARDHGVDVDRTSIARLRRFVIQGLDSAKVIPDTTYGTRRERWRTASRSVADRLAAAHFLQRAGDARARAEVVELLPFTSWMAWEDRIWLAQLLHDTGHRTESRDLLSGAWSKVTLAGARVDIPDSLVSTGLFASRVRPAARLLSATMAIAPDHPWLGALVERIVQRARGEGSFWWNTQDHASAAVALSEFTARHRGRSGHVMVRSGGRLLTTLAARGANVREAAIPLEGLVEPAGDSAVIALRLMASDGPVYYALTVDEVPRTPSVMPDVRGISVERWYERFDDGRPVTELREGELVRVRLRVTVPGDREFVAIEDPLPAGLEAVDLSMRTAGTLAPFSTAQSDSIARERHREAGGRPLGGSWYGSWWSPWEHSEKRDDRVLYFARLLWKGTYTASYVARATTSGRFVRPPAHAEEMYNPALNGRSEGGWFRIVERRNR